MNRAPDYFRPDATSFWLAAPDPGAFTKQFAAFWAKLIGTTALAIWALALVLHH